MDPEKQPLLNGVGKSELRLRRCRVLTTDEVMDYRHDVTWRRTRIFLVIIFWSILAMLLSIVTCIIVTAPRCNSVDTGLKDMPIVAPVHLNLASLMYSVRDRAEPYKIDNINT